MEFVTKIALRRGSVTVLAIILVLFGGIYKYQTLPVELFPEIEFPLVTVTAFYPSSNPGAVVKEVTEPIEKSIMGIDGLESIQSVSSESRSVVLANFKFGTDMAEVENIIDSNVGNIQFAYGITSPIVGRINPNSFPVLQFSVISASGDTELVDIQEVIESEIVPTISNIDGVFSVEVSGDVKREVVISVDPEKMLSNGISIFQVSQSLKENNITLPAGRISGDKQVYPVKTTHSYKSIDDLSNLVVGYPRLFGSASESSSGSRATPVTLGEVADIHLGAGILTSVSRTNGRPSIGINVTKKPDANTIDVTTDVVKAIENFKALPGDIEVVTISNDGPEIQAQIHTLEREAIIGLILAVSVVFVFFVSIKPSVVLGIITTLRPTIVIGLSIPLSILMGVLIMSWQGLSLNFMTLGGLAISVGRVVDDSIVVLENIYRNIQGGKGRWKSALDATVEVAPAITASTLTTIVVFVPLGFIKGLVGAFFFPFALTVSYALLASLLVALTAVPVLGAYLIRPGDLPDVEGDGDKSVAPDTWLQRGYVSALKWALVHKAIALIVAVVITAGSLGLVYFIPVNLFPSGADRFITIDMSLKPGTPMETTLLEVETIENAIKDVSEIYVTTVGNRLSAFGQGGVGGFNQSLTYARLNNQAAANTTSKLREELHGVENRIVNVRDANSGGPPSAGLDINISGGKYDDIKSVAGELYEELQTIEGIENITSDVSEAREEIVVEVNPALAAAIGLSVQQVGFQLNQFLVGQRVTQVEIDGDTVNVFLRGRSDNINGVQSISGMKISGPLGLETLGNIASIEILEGPVTISRTDGLRSASISGNITADDAQLVGKKIQQKIDEVTKPSGVSVVNGGVFQQIAEGFQDIFLAMAIGIALVYLVMVASLGSLRNPFVIVASLPLALIGAFIALFITGRSLGLPAMMGILLLIGIVVTNAIVLISFVEQLRGQGLNVYDSLIHGGRVRLRPILMTATTTSIALLPLAIFVQAEGGIIGAELATVVIGGLVGSTMLTLVVVPVIYMLVNQSIPKLFSSLFTRKS